MSSQTGQPHARRPFHRVFKLGQRTLEVCRSYVDRCAWSRRTRAMGITMLVEGQLRRVEAVRLFDCAKDVPHDQCIVEIGSYRGRSTTALALGAACGGGAFVYAIDPHDEFVGVLGGTFGPPDQEAMYRNLTWAGVGRWVKAVNLPSTAVAPGWDRTNVGLLWIDGDHRYEAVRADIDLWYPHVVDRGIIALHDADTADVQRAANETVADGRMTPLDTVHTMAVFRKTTARPA